MRVVAVWSGGKDSCLACYEAISKEYEISNLLSFVYTDVGMGSSGVVSNPLSFIYNRVGRGSPRVVSNLLSFVYKDLSRMVPHDVSPEVIALQARAMEIPIVQMEVSWDTFEDQFKTTLRKLKRTDAEGAVWGVVPPHYPLDSSEKLREYSTLIAHKDWVYRVCGEVGIKPIMPLWGMNPEQILADFVEKGFEAIIVVVGSDLLGEEWLGRTVNHDFLHEVRRLNRERGIHVGGSAYHTLVTDGPLFKKRLKVLRSRKVSKNGYFFLEISKVELIEKDMER
jgi:diphthine-ammonia ligase